MTLKRYPVLSGKWTITSLKPSSIFSRQSSISTGSKDISSASLSARRSWEMSFLVSAVRSAQLSLFGLHLNDGSSSFSFCLHSAIGATVWHAQLGSDQVFQLFYKNLISVKDFYPEAHNSHTWRFLPRQAMPRWLQPPVPKWRICPGSHCSPVAGRDRRGNLGTFQSIWRGCGQECRVPVRVVEKKRST